MQESESSRKIEIISHLWVEGSVSGIKKIHERKHEEEEHNFGRERIDMWNLAD